MVVSENQKLSGVRFFHGFDATADLLNALQQYVSTELTERTRDLVKYPGFSWGFRVGSVSGQNVTIVKGVGFDQQGARLYQRVDGSYGIVPPTTSTTAFYLCAKAVSKDVLYKTHPYDGSRLPVERVVAIQFFTDTSVYTDADGNVYPSANNGLVVAKLTVSGSSYVVDDLTTGTRSPNLTLRNGA